jgi:flagellar protein FlaJ
MFKLIAKTKEYGEVSVEVEKISNLIEVFGYDLLSSARSVTSTTPSKTLKEFFEGLISTIETGGSLKSFLSQKSKEALLSYQLERQKYTESIATYSDIYTGLLIAAPLFFVSTLSLVSLLGGKIGTMEVGTVISLGTYVLIPALNIMFIMFLELNQPQV